MRLCRWLFIAGVVLTGLCLGWLAWLYPWPAVLVGAGILIHRFRRNGFRLTSHGTARWAAPAELERAGMIGGDGLCIGRVTSGRPPFWQSLKDLFDFKLECFDVCYRLMMSMRVLQPQQHAKEARLNRAVHTMVVAPTGAGNGVSFLVPFLRGCRESFIVIDPKGENAKLTAEEQQSTGAKVIFIDPFNKYTKTPDTLNPLASIDPSSPTALDDCRAIAKEMVVRTGMEPDQHWNDSAESLLAALCAASLFFGDEGRNLQSVRDLLSNAAARDKVLAAMQASDDWGGMLRRLGSQVANLKDKELAGVLSTANRHTAFLDTIPVAASTRTSSFDPAALRNGRLAVYLILPPEYLRSQSGLMRLWVGTLLRACVREGLNEGRKVHFVLDEAASLGRLEVLDDAVDKYRGYGVRMQFFYQSLGQLKKCWGNDGGDQTLLSNTTQVFFAVNDPQTAEYVSNRLGEETIAVSSGGTNGGGSEQHSSASVETSRTASWGWSSNWNQTGRKLLKPEEVAALNQRIAITFTPGVRPICTALTRYYEARPGNGFWRRLRMKTEVWAAGFGLLTLSAMAGVWLAVNTYPRWR